MGHIVSEKTKIKLHNSNVGKSYHTKEQNESHSLRMKGKVPWNKGLKGAQVAWNKGLTIDNPIVQKYTEKRKNTILEKYGKTTPWQRKKGEWTPSEDCKEKQSKSAEERWLREHDKIVDAQNIGKANSPLFKEVHSKNMKELYEKFWATPEGKKRFKEEINPKMVSNRNNSEIWKASVTSYEYKQKISANSIITWQDPKHIENMSNKAIKRWQDPNYRESQVKAVMLGNSIKPNIKEMTLFNLLQVILPNTYKYVGDGQVILNGKCPDFIDFENKKIIELYGDYWHSKTKTGIEEHIHEKDRIEHFQKLGFECLIIWEKELKNLHLVQEKIMVYHKLPNITGDTKNVF